MEIADYIPDYPELNDPNFNNKIFHKKEFYDLRTGAQKTAGEKGKLWPHQELMARFLSPYTPYNEQLLFHTPGTGKTCAASAIVEINKQDPLVRKPVLVIVPNDTLVNQWKQQIALICTSGQYLPENYFNLPGGTHLTDAEKTTRLNKLIRPVYHITTMERMRRQIDKFKGPSGDKILRNRYSNTIVIIDEAHNLRIQSNTSKKNVESSKGRYKAFHRFLHLIINSKIVLLTGTPMYDRIGELPGLMNLILPLDKQLPIGKKFSNEYLRKSNSGLRKLKNEKALFKYLIGKVSYIREGGDFPRREDLGKHVWTEFLRTENVTVSDLQLQGYLQAYAKDTAKGEDQITGLWKNSRQASVFVYKNKEEYIWGAQASALLTEKHKARSLTIKNRKVTFTPITIKQQYRDDLKKNLGLYSAKYQWLVDFVQKHKEPTFIFTPLVSGTGGAIFLGLILGLFGFNKATGTEKSSAPRYALITGDEKSSVQRKSLIDIFNSPENENGEIIQIMIATKTISEGTSFTNVRHEIVVSPYWNNSGTEQAIARGLRADSLKGLPSSERVVTVQELAITSPDLPEKENIDAHMYKMSEMKDFEIKEFERVLKRIAWDCPLNYARNVRAIDKDNSRSCDYQKCNYVCYQTTPHKVKPKWTYSIPEDQLDESTYLLYYSKPELLRVVEGIKEILRKFSYINLEGLNMTVETESFKLLILAIEYIIENHVTVLNKWGQPCFLRKEGNMLFLSDTATEKDVMGSWYARYPYTNQRFPLSQIINDRLLEEDRQKMKDFEPDAPDASEIINSLHLESRIFIFESLLELNPETMTKKQRKMLNAFLEIFKGHTFKLENTVVHDLEKTKLSQNYVDFTKGENGSLRCFKDHLWSDCNKKEEEDFSTVIKESKSEATEDITTNKYGVYGIMTTYGKFQIADTTKETQVKKSDQRRKYTGRVCQFWKKKDLIELYLRLNIKPGIPLDTSIKDKTQLLKELKKLGLTEIVPKGATIQTLQKIYTLGKQKIKTQDKTPNLCDTVEKWFVDNKLVIYSS